MNKVIEEVLLVSTDFDDFVFKQVVITSIDYKKKLQDRCESFNASRPAHFAGVGVALSFLAVN